METYRGSRPRPDATFWYGPFDGRWAIPIALLAIGAFLLLVALHSERESFRSLSCARPGLCTVERGSWLLGARAVETFDTDAIVEAQQRRTTGKSSRRQLLLVDRGGNELLLAEGAVVPELFAGIQPFFASKGPDSVTVRAPASIEGWIIAGVASLIALVGGLWSARSSFRAAVRIRVEVLHSEGVVRVAGPHSHQVDVPIAEIARVAVTYQSISSRAGRVCLMCRTEPDVPLLDRYVYGTAHATLAAELREALGLPTEG